MAVEVRLEGKIYVLTLFAASSYKCGNDKTKTEQVKERIHMSAQSNTNGYLLIFRGADWHKGLSPEEMQRVSGEWMAWYKRLSDQGKVTGGNPLEPSGKVVSERVGASLPTVLLPNPRKPSAVIFSLMSIRWRRRWPSRRNVRDCPTARALKCVRWLPSARWPARRRPKRCWRVRWRDSPAHRNVKTVYGDADAA